MSLEKLHHKQVETYKNKFKQKNQYFLDNKNVVENDEFQLKRCKQHADEWKRIQENNLVNRNTDKIEVFSSILEAVNFLNQQSKCDVLITGSLHLVGAALSVIQEESQLLTHAI